MWAGVDPAPDTLPVPKSKLRPDYPDEMRKTGEIGYVIISRYVDATGKSLSMRAEGTHVPFQRAVEDAFQGWEMRPAKRGDQAVNAEVWAAVIFNPKSATAKGADATPRLLAVTPAVAKISEPIVVRMRLSLDAAGAITQATPEAAADERALSAIQAALKNWRFAPTRQNGQPVASEVVIAALCKPPEVATQAKLVPPVPKFQKRPEYPVAMRRFGLNGQVLLDFVVDPAGNVQNAFVLQTDNPAFDEPALKALREWKFAPATRDGKPVASHQRVPIVFTLNFGEGEKAFTVSGHGDQEKLPPELRYDTPPKIRGVLVPVYPYAQRRDSVRGKAKVKILIDQRGRAAGVKVESADQAEFGLALVAAAEGFSFDPALKDGKPVMHLMGFEQTFGRDELPDDIADSLLSLEKKHPEKILNANGLDAPLKPLSRRAPVFPTGLTAENEQGEAMIDCLIDEEGRVRLPRIVSASNPAFGYSAMQACAAWWFEPPKAGGKPAVVRVRVPFRFAPP
jgi:TonB family protein